MDTLPPPPSRSLPCPLQPSCGGCPEMVHPEDRQLQQKIDFLTRALRRPPDSVVPSPTPLGYRARVSLRLDAAGRAGFSRPRSHEHLPVRDCPIARPELNAVLGALPLLPGLEQLELRSDGAGVVLSARNANPQKPRVTELPSALLDLPGLRGAALDGARALGEDTVAIEVCGVRHRFSPDTFYQVNLGVNERLVAAVRDAVLASAPNAVLDLFSGAGNLSLPLAREGLPITLIEANAAATRDARRTAVEHGLKVQVKTAPAERYQPGDAVFDVVILDPPRAGAGGLVPKLLITRPRTILYVSCNPVALAADLKPAFKAGYTLRSVTLFDMFPQTSHMETLAVLDRPA